MIANMAQFTRVAESSQIEVLRTPYRVPRANAVCERFLGSVRRECLDHLLILSEGQLYRVIKVHPERSRREYVVFFNAAWPQQGINQKIPERNAASGEEKREGRIIAFPILNGLHHDYRKAARLVPVSLIGHEPLFRPRQDENEFTGL
jgi:putative transposase